MDEERNPSRLSDEEIRAIALLVREEIMDDIYVSTGKMVLKKAVQGLVLIGLACAAYFGMKEIK